MAEILSARFDRWIGRRHPPQRETLQLARRRIYILPTSHGYLFFLTLLVLFLWAVNYSNSLGFALTFLLAGVALNAMWRCHNNLLGLRLEALGAEPVFAGEPARFRVQLGHGDALMRPGLCLCSATGAMACEDIDPVGTLLHIDLPTHRRGWLQPGRLRIETRFPLGLFRAWSWVEFDRPVLVYPAPGGDHPLPPTRACTSGDAQTVSLDGGNEDFSGLRDYVPGDSPRHVAWKASTRSGDLLVKRFSGRARPELWLVWSQLAGRDEEHRLEQLCQWVLLAEANGLPYGLKLPGREIAPGLGHIHQANCLRTLALYGLDRTSSQ